MARMIPPFISESVKSNAERKIFDALRLNLSDDYVVIHSLGVADHQTKIYGEIDFVVISNEGILCLEVKGGLVERREGMWYFTDRYGRQGKRAEGPFAQAIGAMFSLRNSIKKKFRPSSKVHNCQFACGVVFPDMQFTQHGPDIIHEIVFDSRQSAAEMDKYISRVFAYWRNELQHKHGFSGGPLDNEGIKNAEVYLRGDFGFVPRLKFILDQTEANLLQLTKEQSLRLSLASENLRIIIEGVAGTGKTLLGMEYARKQVATGRKVLFLCFNTTLARYLQRCIDKSELIIDTFHGHISKVLKNQGWDEGNQLDLDSDYFRYTLPEAYCDHMDGRPKDERFDTLVIDEGQDLFRLEYLMCMEYMVKLGLRDGNWHASYDPNQNLYNTDFAEGITFLRNIPHTYLTLDTNCRNTRPVGIHNLLFTGVRPAKYFRVEGESVVVEAFDNYADERTKVVSTVRRLIGQGVSPGSIVLLSKYKIENSCLGGDDAFAGICAFQNISDYRPARITEKSLKFSTIHSYKGMESQVVILMDVDEFLDDKARLLNYTAISRACTLLYVFHNGKVKDQLDKVIAESVPLLKTILN